MAERIFFSRLLLLLVSVRLRWSIMSLRTFLFLKFSRYRGWHTLSCLLFVRIHHMIFFSNFLFLHHRPSTLIRIGFHLPKRNTCTLAKRLTRPIELRSIWTRCESVKDCSSRSMLWRMPKSSAHCPRTNRHVPEFKSTGNVSPFETGAKQRLFDFFHDLWKFI